MFDKLFSPKSVAIIGASQKALSIGNVITKNLLKYEYKGAIYPINPKADEILGIKAYPSILDVPGDDGRGRQGRHQGQRQSRPQEEVRG